VQYFSFKNRFIIISILLFLVTFFVTSCNRYFVVVIFPTNTTVVTKNKIKARIELSSKSLIKNRIGIINGSSEVVTIRPEDITLEIEQTGIKLPAVKDYHDYVEMRYTEAKKKCESTEYPFACVDGIDKYFKHYHDVKSFQFGEIPARKNNSGYFAFNLPDPFNTTAQAKRTEELLREKGTMLSGKIIVRITSASSGSQVAQIVFPVSIITSSDKANTMLRIMQNY